MGWEDGWAVVKARGLAGFREGELMSVAEKTYAGQCFCGAVTIEVMGDPRTRLDGVAEHLAKALQALLLPQQQRSGVVGLTLSLVQERRGLLPGHDPVAQGGVRVPVLVLPELVDRLTGEAGERRVDVLDRRVAQVVDQELHLERVEDEEPGRARLARRRRRVRNDGLDWV